MTTHRATPANGTTTRQPRTRNGSAAIHRPSPPEHPHHATQEARP